MRRGKLFAFIRPHHDWHVCHTSVKQSVLRKYSITSRATCQRRETGGKCFLPPTGGVLFPLKHLIHQDFCHRKEWSGNVFKVGTEHLLGCNLDVFICSLFCQSPVSGLLTLRGGGQEDDMLYRKETVCFSFLSRGRTFTAAPGDNVSSFCVKLALWSASHDICSSCSKPSWTTATLLCRGFFPFSPAHTTLTVAVFPSHKHATFYQNSRNVRRPHFCNFTVSIHL